jgi:hypothetical protein
VSRPWRRIVMAIPITLTDLPSPEGISMGFIDENKSLRTLQL